jgi:hypothetical protein
MRAMQRRVRCIGVLWAQSVGSLWSCQCCADHILRYCSRMHVDADLDEPRCGTQRTMPSSMRAFAPDSLPEMPNEGCFAQPIASHF